MKFECQHEKMDIYGFSTTKRVHILILQPRIHRFGFGNSSFWKIKSYDFDSLITTRSLLFLCLIIVTSSPILSMYLRSGVIPPFYSRLHWFQKLLVESYMCNYACFTIQDETFWLKMDVLTTVITYLLQILVGLGIPQTHIVL